MLLVGDDPLARGGLAALLAGDPAIEIVAQIGAEAYAPPAPRHDVVLWDLGPHPSAWIERFAERSDGGSDLDLDEGAPVLALLAGAESAAANTPARSGASRKPN